MPKELAKHHKNAATHHEHAAKHHHEAAKHHEQAITKKELIMHKWPQVMPLMLKSIQVMQAKDIQKFMEKNSVVLEFLFYLRAKCELIYFALAFNF